MEKPRRGNVGDFFCAVDRLASFAKDAEFEILSSYLADDKEDERNEAEEPVEGAHDLLFRYIYSEERECKHDERKQAGDHARACH